MITCITRWWPSIWFGFNSYNDDDDNDEKYCNERKYDDCWSEGEDESANKRPVIVDQYL